MAQVPTGTTFYVASALSAAKVVAGISNATEAVVNAVAHGFAAGDIVLLKSGWGRLNDRAFRIKTVTTDSFVLEGQDTTSTQYYPAGSGGGTVQKVASFTQITQVTGISGSGGEPKNVQYKYLESDVEGSINDGFSATQATLEMDADAIGSTGYNTLKTMTETQSTTVIRTNFRNGGLLLRAGTVALNEDPQITDGQIIKVRAAINGNGRVTRYAA